MGFKQRLVSGGFKNTLLAGAVLALCLGAATRQVQAQMAPHEFHPPKAAPDILSQLTQLQGRGVAVAADKATGFARLIGVGAQTPLAAPGMAPGLPPQSNARMALDTYGPLFGLTNPRANTALMKQEVDADGRAMVRYQQTHNGVPVIGGELIVNLTPDGKMTSINGEVSAGLTLAATPRITPDQAAAAALAGTAKWNNEPQANLQASVPVLSVYDPQRLAPDTSPPVLVWRVEVTHTGLAPIRELVLVDALLGGVRLHFNQAADVRNRNTYDFGGVRDTSPSTLPGTFQCGEAATGSTGCTSTAIPDADNVHAFTADTYDFYWNTHGRDSMDGLGMTLTSTTRYCTFSTLYACPYANAYWNGAQMVYGAGVVADDITAHELTHAFTNKTSNLFYFYQSGAINESLSDVWGEFVDQSNGSTDDATTKWQIGEGSVLGVIRNMMDPTLNGDPDKMTSVNYYTGTLDNGGVHTNSGVNNHAAALMVDGGPFNTYTITGIGISKTAKIYYKAQTTLLTSASDYMDLYNALNQACLVLVGAGTVTNADCTQVNNALLAVEMNGQPAAGYNPDAAVCPAMQAPVNAFYDNLESGLGKWSTPVYTSTGGTISWVDWVATYSGSGWGPNATSGIRSLFAYDSPYVTDFSASITVTVPPLVTGTPYLHFRHSYDFETPDWDGGVVEYSTNGGTVWTDALALTTVGKGYGTAIATGSGNVLGGRNGYIGTSHGWVSTRLDLTPLAGQTVKFRWRLGTDSTTGSYGWWLDDVRVYTCGLNTAPTAPSSPTPADKATGVNGTAVTLKWIASTDPDGDPITYDVFLCTDPNFLNVACTTAVATVASNWSNPAVLLAGLGGSGGLMLAGLLGWRVRRRWAWLVIALGLAVSLLTACGGGGGGGGGGGAPPAAPVVKSYPLPGPLATATTHYWRVTAKDNNTGATPGPVWSFTTL